MYTMKKNTLLYLDASLVETAKKQGINISKLTEDALRETLEKTWPLNAQDYVKRLLDDQITGSTYYKSYLLPFAVEFIKFKNIGPVLEFETPFQKSGINIIIGPFGSGKSTIVKSILLVFGQRIHRWHEMINIQSTENAQVSVGLFKDNCSVLTLSSQENIDSTKGYKSLVVDDAFFDVQEEEMIYDILNELAKLKIQVILATSRVKDNSKFPSNTNILRLNGPQVKVTS